MIILAGGSGFIGQHLHSALGSSGHNVITLTRFPTDRPDHIFWDARTPGAWIDCLQSADAVINLAGRSVNCRLTPRTRREIVRSRVDSVRAIGQAIARCADPPPVWIQVSSLGYYSHVEDHRCDESAPPGDSFYAQTTIAWESALDAFSLPHTRKLAFRVGLALHPSGGILKPLAALARYRLAGRMGSGQQGISWIHMSDLARAFVFAIAHPDMEGVYNVTSPEPVAQIDLMCALCRALGGRPGLPLSEPLLHTGAFILNITAHALLEGHYCIPRRLLDCGFRFHYPGIDTALADLLAERPAS